MRRVFFCAILLFPASLLAQDANDPAAIEAAAAAYQAGRQDAQRDAAFDAAPKVQDPDGKGWSKTVGDITRGFRDGVTYTWTRKGNEAYYTDSAGVTGKKTFDDSRRVIRYHIRYRNDRYQIIGEEPYPGNKRFKAWSKRLPLSVNVYLPQNAGLWSR